MQDLKYLDNWKYMSEKSNNPMYLYVHFGEFLNSTVCDRLVCRLSSCRLSLATQRKLLAEDTLD